MDLGILEIPSCVRIDAASTTIVLRFDLICKHVQEDTTCLQTSRFVFLPLDLRLGLPGQPDASGEALSGVGLHHAHRALARYGLRRHAERSNIAVDE